MITAITQSRIEELHTLSVRCETPKETPVVFRNESNYDYHLIIKQLTEMFEM